MEILKKNSDILRLYISNKLKVIYGLDKTWFLKFLIENGADSNDKDISVLMYAYENSLYDIVKLLIEKGVYINTEDIRCKTILIHASKNGYLEMVKFLIENGVDINSKDCYGNTALMCAYTNGYLEIVKFLIEKGADVDRRIKTDLINSSSNGNLEMLKLLIENGVDINSKENDGDTALTIAKKRYNEGYDNSEIIKLLELL